MNRPISLKDETQPVGRKFNTTIFGFVLNFLLVVILSLSAVFAVVTVSTSTEQLYRHPFTVSNAAREIKINLVSMHRYMKDVVLAQNDEQLERASALVAEHEKAAFDSFRVIFDRFLGDKEKVLSVYQTFVAWRDIRNEVIALKHAGETDAAAAITKGKGADHVELLNRQTQELADFAANKAAEFRTNAQDNARNAVMIMSVLALFAVALSIAIAIYIIRNLRHSDEEIKKRVHLIDQNILMARLSPDGVVLEVSNALCRYLGMLREDLLDAPSNFFLASEENNDLLDSIWRNLRTGAPWNGEIKRISSDGSAKWARMSVLPNLDTQYQIEGYTLILQDMTSKKLSLTDNLTTLGNRRQYEETLEREISLAKRNDTYLTLAIVDIDFFKNYNDRYGHPQGDVALAKVGKALMSCMRRPNDYIFRIGGEEFAVLFSGMGQEESRVFLETIRESIEALDIPHEKSSVAAHLTISIGATSKLGSNLPDPDLLYIEADKALYLAKETRNQTVMV